VTNTVRRVSTDRRCGERIRDTNASFRMAFRSAEYVMAAACLHLAGSGAWGDDFMAGMGMTWFMTLSIMRSSSLSPFDTHCGIFVILFGPPTFTVSCATAFHSLGALQLLRLARASYLFTLSHDLFLFRLPQHPRPSNDNRRQSHRNHEIQPKPLRVDTAIYAVAKVEERGAKESLSSVSLSDTKRTHEPTAVNVPGKNTTVTAVITRITALSREVDIATCCEVSARSLLVSAMLMLFAESR
jgi:hypothetical protein